MIRRVVSRNFPSSTVDGGRFVPRFVPHGRHSSMLAVDAPSAALRRPGPRRPRPPSWRHVGTPARRRRRGALRRHGRAEHAADSPRVSPNRGYGCMLPLDEFSDVGRHRNFQLLVLLAERALLRRREALGLWRRDDPVDAGVVGPPPAAHRHGVARFEVDAVRAVRAAVGAAARVPLRAAAVAHAVWEAAPRSCDWARRRRERPNRCRPLGLSRAPSCARRSCTCGGCPRRFARERPAPLQAALPMRPESKARIDTPPREPVRRGGLPRGLVAVVGP